VAESSRLPAKALVSHGRALEAQVILAYHSTADLTVPRDVIHREEATDLGFWLH